MKRHILVRTLFAGVIVAAAFGSWLRAEVSTRPATLSIYPSQNLYIPLKLDATAGEAVAALSGQATYDPALFTNPVIQVAPATTTFIALSNVTTPGKVRFVLYANPTTQMPAAGETVAFLRLTAAATLPRDGQSTVTFLNGPLDINNPDRAGQSSAATTAGGSVSTVNFNQVIVELNKNAAEAWLIYE